MSRIPPSTQEMITTASRAAVKTQLKTLCCQKNTFINTIHHFVLIETHFKLDVFYFHLTKPFIDLTTV